MNLYNFTLDRDKLLHQIKARNFTWFLSIACVSCYGPEKVSVKDAGMASGLPSREENMQTNLPIFETFVRGNHYTGGCGGMEGAGEGGLLTPLHLRRKCVRALFINNTLLPPPAPPRPASPGAASRTWVGAWVLLPLCGGPSPGGFCRGPSSFCRRRRLEKPGVALRVVWFGMIIFGFSFYSFGLPFSLSLLASLP